MSTSVSNWSVPVRLADVPETGLTFDLVPDATAHAAVARTAGVIAVPRLEARFDVTRHGRDGLRVTGSVSATVDQTCVVTLEPLQNEIAEPVDLTFVPARDDAEGREEVGTSEPPEVLVNGAVDLGAIASEFVTLAVDPYPRKPGAVFASPVTGEPTDHPFAALAALKKR